MTTHAPLRPWIGLVVVVVGAACNAAAGLDQLDFGGGAGGVGGEEGEGGGVSTPTQSIGTPCDDNADCASGSCADGVCCDQACVGDCVSCDQLNLFGVCSPHTGSDPEGDCGAAEVCGADGECTPIDGRSCADDADCTSGFCTDGVCCNERCEGPCESCLMSNTGGVDGICGAVEGDAPECATGGCIAKGQCCGEGLTVPPPRSCPPQCTGGCGAGACKILCTEATCSAQNIVCPSGMDCVVQCLERHACQDAAIDCPPDHRCDVTCGGGSDDHHGCERAQITCSNGPCSIACEGNESPCTETVVLCGSNACDVECDGAEPAVTCGGSCACATCS